MDHLNNLITLVINPAITLLIALAVVMFLWGVAQFVMNSDNEENRQSGAQHILWGLIGLAIMVGAVAIKSFIQNSINF